MASYPNQDKVTFDRAIRQLWWDALNTATGGGDNTDALAPSNCSDSEHERRKHELVRYAVATGITDDANVPSYTDCQ